MTMTQVQARLAREQFEAEAAIATDNTAAIAADNRAA